ncbi:uroporphyrinogen-III synthase [Ignavibacterium sp.]|uniref:uroporphyrinogen-III synthase n=1 Tax=Ignavibacterium sp. TaxID=2651167 RepID=UPI00307EC262
MKKRRHFLKEQKKGLILDKATELFARKDFYEVMMDDVAHLSKVAKGTLYNYFESKEELYNQIILNNLENLLSSVRSSLSNELSIIELLYAYVSSFYQYLVSHKNFFRIYLKIFWKEDEEIETSIKLKSEELSSILSDIIYKGKRENLFRDLEEDFVIRLIIGNIFNSVKRSIDNNFSHDQLLAERENLFDFILNSLYAGFDNSIIRPLKNKTIVLTRTVEQSTESAAVFSELGAKVITFPTLEIVPPANWKNFDEMVLDKNKPDFIIFTSAHTVTMFAQRLKELQKDFDFSHTKVVAIGSKTNQICTQNNIPVNIVPEKFSGEGVVAALSKFNLKNKIIFIPRSAIGRAELPKGLEELGAIIKTVPVYNVSLPRKSVVEESLKQLKESKPDVYVFTSPSTFENFLTIMKIDIPANYFKGVDVAAIGPTTKSAIESRKVKVNIMPSEYTIKGLANKMIEYYRLKEK